MSEQERRCCPLEHPGHPDRPSYSAPGSVCCAGHIAKILAVLSQLSTFDADADQAIHDQALSRHVGAPVSGDPEPPLPIDPRITEHRQQIGQVLASWCQLVAEERDIRPPEGVTTALCAFLARHHGWSVEQPWADDYAAEILELGRRAWSLLNPSGRRRFEVGQCGEMLTGEFVGGVMQEQPCAGTLWALLLPADPYEPEFGSEIACDACGHRVNSADWMRYGRKIKAREQEAAA